MKCPACNNGLTPMQAGEVTVDICKEGCGGIWFDNFELKKFDEPHESEGEILLDIPKKNSLKVDVQGKRGCPKCPDIKMHQHFFSVKRHVTVDECAQCAGIWLDAGELGQIRSLFKTEKERKEAAQKYFSELFDGKLHQMSQESDEKLNKVRRFSNMFKFLCPSAYIPGKQEWGAF